jgi:hypothetical protein
MPIVQNNLATPVESSPSDAERQMDSLVAGANRASAAREEVVSTAANQGPVVSEIAAVEEEDLGEETGVRGPPQPPIFSSGDASDAYANDKALYLSIYHLAANQEVNFKAFITAYNQNLTSDWTPEQVFGRNDPIMTFKNTTRKLNLSFQVPAASLEEATRNLVRANKLAQFMYPAYSDRATLDGGLEWGIRANTISKPPLMRVSFANLIGDPLKGQSSQASRSGLLVAVGTLNITPSFEDDGFFDAGVGVLYPQLITIDMDCTVLHERDLGWDASGQIGQETFGFSNPANSNFIFGFPSQPPPGTNTSAPNPENATDEAVTADLDDEAADAQNVTDPSQMLTSTNPRYRRLARQARNQAAREVMQDARQTARSIRQGGSGNSGGGGGY